MAEESKEAEKLRIEINRLSLRITREQGGQAVCDALEAKLEALKDAYSLT
jgi:hypothetical protein